MPDNEQAVEADPILAEVVPINDVVSNLLDAGLSTEMVANAVGVPVQLVRTIVVTRRQSTLSPDEEALAQEVRALAAAVVKEARLKLEFGSPEYKMQVIRAILPNLTRMYGVDQDGEVSETRTALESILATQRTVPLMQPLVTDEAIVDVKAKASTLSIVNPDKEP